MSKNFKTGLFKRRELLLYGLEENQIDIIIKYQKLLPILQEDNNFIDGRTLHEQLVVNSGKIKKDGTVSKGKVFGAWIKERIEKYEFINKEDYYSYWQKDGEVFDVSKIGIVDLDINNSNQMARNGYTLEYKLTTVMAKELCMLENNIIGKTARKYFIYIEQAFKDRYNWNVERDKTLIKCKELKDTIQENEKILLDTVPYWSANVYQAEFCLLNEVVTGMNAKTFREENNLKPSDPIRNHFTKDTLNIIAELEKFDADLIAMMDIYDYEARRKLLRKKFLKIA